MGIQRTFKSLCALVFLAAGLGSCTRGDKSPAVKGTQHHEVRYAGKLKVGILPEIPTAAEDLQVVFSGGGSVAYRWEKNGQEIEGEKGARLAKKWFSRGDRITAVVTANGEEGRASLTIESAPPQVVSVSVTPENICRGVDITAVPVGSDADGDPVRYSYKWIVNDQEQPGDTPVLRGDRIKCGDRVSVKVTPSDSYGAGREYATQSFVIPSAAPYFVSHPPTTFSGDTYIYEARAEDPDGDAISYALVSPPSGMTINNNTGRLEWQVARQTRNYDVEIEAKDSKGASARQRYTLAITIP